MGVTHVIVRRLKQSLEPTWAAREAAQSRVQLECQVAAGRKAGRCKSTGLSTGVRAKAWCLRYMRKRLSKTPVDGAWFQLLSYGVMNWFQILLSM